MSNKPVHPDDIEFCGQALAQFNKEFQKKFIEGAEAHFHTGPLIMYPRPLRMMKEEVLDQWSYVVAVEKLHEKVRLRLMEFTRRNNLTREQVDELSIISGLLL